MLLREVYLLDVEREAQRPEVLDETVVAYGLAQKENFGPADQSSLFRSRSAIALLYTTKYASYPLV